ncbi:MAG: Hsp20/alpha crystallin family protein [Deltaproteobacteria bacterium]|nr:Hsp20/alpha crystallin family protein [Deltaproteobacteria bacterium]
MTLVKWDAPYAPDARLESLLGLRRGIDRLFEEFFEALPKSLAGPEGAGVAAAFSPPIDLKETEKDFVLKVELPGLHKEDLSVDITDESVTLQGERREESETPGACYRCQESRYGAFRRVVEMPQQIVPESARAKLEDGVLSVILPKAEAGNRKHIRVEVE